MNLRRLRGFALPAALLLVSVPAVAHHGAAAYEAKLTTMQGTVTEFRFLNPHATIAFDARDAAGHSQKWVAESVSASSMSRGGWTKDSLKPGEQITITGNCAKNGNPAMRLSKLVKADGKVLSVTRGEDYAGQ